MPLIVIGAVLLAAGLAGRFMLEDPLPPMGLALVGALVLLLGYTKVRSGGGRHSKQASAAPAQEKPKRQRRAKKVKAPKAAKQAEQGGRLSGLRAKLNQPIGGKGTKADEDDGPLFPKEIMEAEPLDLQLASTPAPGLAPDDALDTTPGASADPAAIPGAQGPPAPGTPDAPTDEPPEPAPVAGRAGEGEIPGTEPEQPTASGSVVQELQQAIARPRGRRVCAYCWQPNEPLAETCGACGETLRIA